MTIAKRLKSYRDSLVELALLAATMVAMSRAFPSSAAPAKAAFVLLAVAAFILPARQPVGAGPTAYGRRRLLPLLAVGTAGVVLYRFIFHLAWPALLVVPVWYAAAAVWRLGRLAPRHLQGTGKFARLLRRGQRCLDGLGRGRDDLAAGEAFIVGSVCYLGGSFHAHFWPRAWWPWALAVLWAAGRRLAGWHRLEARLLTEAARLAVSVGALVGIWWAAFRVVGPLDRAHAVVLGAAVLAITGWRAHLRRTAPQPAGGIAENVRLLFLAGAALWLLRGFASFILQGGGDALWYGTTLADMIAQTRAGIFPVWVGQSIYQFNGAIYPLRVAPAFHYFGALLDALTLHTLGVFALQNLLITLVGLATMLIAYACLAALMPRHRWLAAGLALLYVACPGVLGLAYYTDLYMSWMTLPWLPLVWYATVRSFRPRPGWRIWLLLGGAVGLCWWGHSPIALWMTLFAAAAQGVRIVLQRPGGGEWLRMVAGAAAFLAVAAYPVASVLLFPPEAGVNAAAFQAASAGNIVHFIRQVFPAVLLPLSTYGRSLGDFQLGYSLWAVLAFGLWHLKRSASREGAVLLGLAVFLVVLVTPVPGLNLALWHLVPALVRNITGNWVMNRLYLVLAGAVVFGGAAVVPAVWQRPVSRRLVCLMVAVGCAWSLSEAVNFVRGSRRYAHSPQSAVNLLRPENVRITRFAYLIFPQTPDNFNSGVVDPAMDNALLARRTFTPLVSDLSAALAAGRMVGEGHFVRAAKPDERWLRLTPSLQLAPGRHYLLRFDFQQPAKAHGVLELTGPTLFREYLLPDYGGTKSFGVGGKHTGAFSLWTTAGVREPVSVRFIPRNQTAPLGPLLPFAQVRLLAYDPASLPVRVIGWMPYQAQVHSPAAAWLETPRMHQRGYVATVNGHPAPVSRSPDGRACVAVPAGRSTVRLAYRPPAGLVAAFWISLAAMAGLAAGEIAARTRRAAPRDPDAVSPSVGSGAGHQRLEGS